MNTFEYGVMDPEWSIKQNGEATDLIMALTNMHEALSNNADCIIGYVDIDNKSVLIYSKPLQSFIDLVDEGDVEEATEEAFDEGYEEGTSDGFDDGYNEGYDEGYDEGLEDGRKESEDIEDEPNDGDKN